MKTSEFKEAVELLGFSLDIGESYVSVEDKNGSNLVMIYKGFIFGIDTSWIAYKKLCYKSKKELFEFAIKYAATPLEEREPENRYHLKLMAPILTDDEYCFLNKNANEKNYLINNKEEALGYKTIFTESELETMDLTGFEKVEVTE